MNTKIIASIGFVAFIGIMGILTGLFNLFWSGLGTDSSRHALLPATKNLEEFKEYAALYIALLSFGASLFAGFVVFLVFNDWKKQHNQSIDSKYYDLALGSLKEISITIRKLKLLHDDCKNLNDKNEYVDITIFTTNYRMVKNELNQKLDNFQGELIFLQAMSNEESSNKIENIFRIFIKPMKEKLQECSILEKNYSISNNHEVIEHDLMDISRKVGIISAEHLKTIVKDISSKIKA